MRTVTIKGAGAELDIMKAARFPEVGIVLFDGWYSLAIDLPLVSAVKLRNALNVAIKEMEDAK